MKAKIPFKNGYLYIAREYHSLPLHVKTWFRDYFWKKNQELILLKVRENINDKLYLEVEEIIDESGIRLEVKLKKENH